MKSPKRKKGKKMKKSAPRDVKRCVKADLTIVGWPVSFTFGKQGKRS